LSLALGVEAVKAGRSVYFGSLADIIGALAKAEREEVLREKIRFFCRFAPHRRRDRLPPSHSRLRQSLLSARQRPLREGRHDLDLADSPNGDMFLETPWSRYVQKTTKPQQMTRLCEKTRLEGEMPA
jgi:hypothetical protein